jgi:ornithine carbamoyltransferase
MAANSRVPVINSLSDDYHPCQLLADLMTIQEHKGKTAGLTLAYVGDAANNMANSYLVAGALAGMHVRIAAPAGYQPAAQVVSHATSIAQSTKGSVTICSSPEEAVNQADVVTTDTWISMGQESEKAQRIKDFAGYSVDEKLMSGAARDAIFMHCLPAYRGYEVSEQVLDGVQSVIWNQAENRLHAQKALMVWLSEQS